jgi:DnaJ-class molecular chaperone
MAAEPKAKSYFRSREERDAMKGDGGEIGPDDVAQRDAEVHGECVEVHCPEDDCKTCKGCGAQRLWSFGRGFFWATCPDCNGTGKAVQE